MGLFYFGISTFMGLSQILKRLNTKISKGNGTDDRDVDFIFLWRLIRLVDYGGIVCKLSSCAPVMTINGLDFDKIRFLVVFLRTFELNVIDILIKL